MEPEERYERLTKCLAALREDNASTVILVEGKRDVAALRSLGCKGEILVYNAGRSLPDTAGQLARNHRRVIVLLDWDRTGGHLVQRLKEQLAAQVELDLAYRKEFAIVSQVRSVEDLPSALTNWSRRAGTLARRDGDAEE